MDRPSTQRAQLPERRGVQEPGASQADIEYRAGTQDTDMRYAKHWMSSFIERSIPGTEYRAGIDPLLATSTGKYWYP